MAVDAELIAFVLGDAESSLQRGQEILSAAQQLDVDPLALIAHRAGLDEAVIFKRAAEYFKLPFSGIIPKGLPGELRIDHIDRLGSTRSVRLRLFDRDVTFLCPTFRQFLTLGESVRSMPGLRRTTCVVPPPVLRNELATRHRNALLAQSRQRLARLWPFASAHLELTRGARIAFVMVLLILVAAAAMAPFWLEPVLVPLLGVLFFLPAWFRLSALFEQWSDEPEPRTAPPGDADLPVYSILIPLRDEAHMVPQLIAAMRALDYPPEKLDIKFVVEAESRRTMEAVRAALADPRFELVVVPLAQPQTKPKALNYALPLVRGTYLVIYDAEDVPEPQQLRYAARRFSESSEIDCLQAELVIDNAGESWLTALFAAEYSGLFGVMLPALAKWRLPMPLGGTSNHFRVSALREVGGWDAFNVTEDADLGVRLSRLRYRTSTLASKTYEEAPVTLGPWLRQRSRWMKGWMQTFIVHNRYAGQFLRDAGWRNFLAFQIHVGGMILSAPLHLVFVAALASRMLFGGALGFGPLDLWGFAHLFVLIAGYAGAAGHAIAGVARLRHRWLYLAQVLLPLYWVLIGIAAFRALGELLFRPYFWAKTTHGVTRAARHTVSAPAIRTIAPIVREMERVKGIELGS